MHASHIWHCHLSYNLVEQYILFIIPRNEKETLPSIFLPTINNLRYAKCYNNIWLIFLLPLFSYIYFHLLVSCRGMMDENNEQFVAYFVPTQETLRKRLQDVHQTVSYQDGEE